MSSLRAARVLQEEAAKVLSDIRDGCRTSQKAMDTVVSGVNGLFDLFLDLLQEKLDESLITKSGYLTLHDIKSEIETNFRGQSIFEGVGSVSTLESYSQKKSGGGEESCLKQVVFTWKPVLRKGIPVFVPDKYGFYVLFLNQLEQLLNCDDVLECVDNPQPAPDGVFRSVTDGLFFKHHPMVREKGTKTLAICIYLDDLEVCDSLKSKSNKHYLRVFYWMLGNILPKLRSGLNAINLLALVNAKVAKRYGNDHFLEKFLEAIQLLGTEGAVLTVKGMKRRFYAVLLFASGDNPALTNLGRLKETHSALRPCRSCMVTKHELCSSFRESSSLLRRKREYEAQLKQVLQSNKKIRVQIVDVNVHEEEALLVEDPTGGYMDHQCPSVNFGINGGSCLSEAPGFDVTKCLMHDVMHSMCEGVIDQMCRQLLQEACFPEVPKDPNVPKPKVLTLPRLNELILRIDLRPLKKNKPSNIEKSHIFSQKLKQSAAQLAILLYLMPFLVKEYISEEKLQCLLQLIDLFTMHLSFEFLSEDIVKLEDLTDQFGSNLKRLWPKVNTLNLHGIIHYATQIRLFGHLRQHWCFRYE